MEQLRNEIIQAIKNANPNDMFVASEHEAKVIQMMRHSIGLSIYGKVYHRHGKTFYKAYRNYYDAGGNDILYWEVLTELGLAYKNRMYHLTEEGMRWLGNRIRVTILERN